MVHPPKSLVADHRLRQAMQAIPRDLFLPGGTDGLEASLPTGLRGEGRIIPPVELVAMMLQALALDGTERVLDVGSGSGYQAALLGRLARDVVAVQFDEDVAKSTAAMLTRLGCSNVRVVHADATTGWPKAAPYQGILVGAAAWELPARLVDQLDVGGRLVIALGDEEAQLVERLRKRVDGLDSETIGACRLGMLPRPRGAPSPFPWTCQHGE